MSIGSIERSVVISAMCYKRRAIVQFIKVKLSVYLISHRSLEDIIQPRTFNGFTGCRILVSVRPTSLVVTV